MQTDTTKMANKTTKRKVRNKRRKQQKLHQKPSGSTKRSTRQFEYAHRRSQMPQNLYQQHCQLHEGMQAQARGLQLWRQTYETVVRWHCSHQMNFWRQRAEQLQLENDYLKRNQTWEMQNGVQDEYDTSSEEEEEEEYNNEDEEAYVEVKQEDCEQRTDVDADYLKFLAITHKHREELRLAREQSEAETGF